MAPGSPKPAFGFPWKSHKTVAQLWNTAGKRLEDLDWISKRRALTDPESREMERLLKRVPR